MTAEKQALYESIISTLQSLEQRAGGNDDKIAEFHAEFHAELVELKLKVAKFKSDCDIQFGVYDGIVRGISFTIKVLGGIILLGLTAILSMAVYILKSKGVL